MADLDSDCADFFLQLSWSVSVLLPTVVLLLGTGVESSTQEPHKTAFIKGDVLIGALVSVHHQPHLKSAFSRTCGDIREQYGVQRVEAAMWMIDQINSNPDLLPNITLGIEIRDSCWYSPIALQQSIEFIRDAIAGPDGASSVAGSGCFPIRRDVRRNLVGVVGPGSSAVTIQVQNLLQLFNIPQVSYSATSKDLSDKARFGYFLRVVPSDYYQAQVLVDIVRHYNWTYVSVVHTDGNYGQSGISAFRELAEKNGICIAKEDSILSNAETHEFDEVILRLNENEKANVVVCFCEGMTIRQLLQAVQRNAAYRFFFIGSDGWADRSDVVSGIEEAAVRGMSIKIYSPYVAAFDEYYFSLRPETNLRNPWFREFWQFRFNCSLTEEGLERRGLRPCTGNETLRDHYTQDTKMAFVIKSILTMARGLHNMQKDLCNGTDGLCSEMTPVNGSTFRDYLMNSTISYLNEELTFDSKGDPPGRYHIMNFQKLDEVNYEYIQIGTWNNGTLWVNDSAVVFGLSNKAPPTSACFDECQAGQARRQQKEEGEEMCCSQYRCIDCVNNEYLYNDTTCLPCHKGMWPDINRTTCEKIEPTHHNLRKAESQVALSIAFLGLLATSFTMAVFIRFNDTPVVKASSRELSYFIFVGMMMSYLSSVPLLDRPSHVTCFLSRILPALSFATIYAALVIKTNRIARILSGNKKIRIKKHRFMSATAQVILTCLLISVEVAILLVTIIEVPPNPVSLYPDYPLKKTAILICNSSESEYEVIVPMSWDFLLIVSCTYYAFKTRNLPENFNEAKFIGFTMYTTCVIWLAWVPIYFKSVYKLSCMSICTSLSAVVTMLLIFSPRLYIILFRPEKNNRSEFKTTTTVRCHIGSSKSQIQATESLNASHLDYRSSLIMSDLQGSNKCFCRRLRSVFGRGGNRREPIKRSLKEKHPRAMLTSCSTWNCSNEALKSVFNRKEILFEKALRHELENSVGLCWEQSCQTSDDLLDPLIPRLRRRVAKAVREKRTTEKEGREFFTLTQSWMMCQAALVQVEKVALSPVSKEETSSKSQQSAENDGNHSSSCNEGTPVKRNKPPLVFPARCASGVLESSVNEAQIESSQNNLVALEEVVNQKDSKGMGKEDEGERRLMNTRVSFTSVDTTTEFLYDSTSLEGGENSLRSDSKITENTSGEDQSISNDCEIKTIVINIGETGSRSSDHISLRGDASSPVRGRLCASAPAKDVQNIKFIESKLTSGDICDSVQNLTDFFSNQGLNFNVTSNEPNML